MSDEKQAVALTARIDAARRAVSPRPAALLPFVVAAQLQQLQAEVAQIVLWSQDVERFIGRLEKQIESLASALNLEYTPAGTDVTQNNANAVRSA